MSPNYSMKQIEQTILQLSLQEQLTLLAKLAQAIKTNEQIKQEEKDEVTLKDIFGMGKGQWCGNEDAQDYVNRIRKDRDII